MEKVVRKRNLKQFSEIKENLAFWLSKSPEERLSAIELLWREQHGSEARLQKVVRVIQRRSKDR